MMQSSPGSSPVSATVTKGVLSATASGHAAAKPADELFGPVLAQQTDAQRQATDAASNKNPASGAADQKREAEPAADGPHADTTTARATARPAEDAETQASAEENPDGKDEDTLLAPVLILAVVPDADVQAQPDSGKILPVDGKFLPVTALFKSHDIGNGTALGGESGTADTESLAILPPVVFRNSAETSFANTGRRDSNLAAVATTDSGESAIGRNATSPLFADAFFTAALQKTLEMPAGFGNATSLELLSQLTNIEKTPENTTALANPVALTGTEKLLAPRPMPAITPALTAFQISPQPGSPEWNNQVADSIRWMSKSNISLAELKLNPAELGSIEIRIYTEDQQTRVSIVTSQAATREIIESTLSRLREMLQSSGLQLEHSDVSHRSGAETDSGRHARQEDSVSKDAFFNEHDSIQSHGLISRRPDSGQIDHYV